MKLVLRALIVLAGFVGAWLAFANAVAEVGAPRAAAFPFAGDSLKANALSEIVSGGFAEAMERSEAQLQSDLPRLPEPLVELARRSYSVDPLEVSTLRTLALGSVLHGDPQRARELMRIAARISKRDSVTNLWLAQDYAQLGDLDQMLASFDHALRTSGRVRAFAMKPFVETLASEASYRPIGELLSHNPDWEAEFWREFVRNPVSVDKAAAFFANSGIPVDRLADWDRNMLYANLKRMGLFESLYRLSELETRDDAGIQALAAGEFLTTEQGYPLGWTLYSRGNASAQVRKTGGLQIDARAGSFGTAADRVARVAGSDELRLVMAEPVPGNARLDLEAQCVDGSNRDLGTIVLGPGEREGELLVPDDACSFASFKLSFAVQPGRRDALIRIAGVELR